MEERALPYLERMQTNTMLNARASNIKIYNCTELQYSGNADKI